MHDFGKLVYLDLQKTGSTFVSEFLSIACLCAERKLQKHGWITDDYRPDATYFITVRHPFALYSSLFRYGLDQKGGIFQRLQQARHLSAYDSFDRFIRFLLDPDNAPLLHPRFTSAIAKQIGFMSFRYMVLNLQYPFRKMAACIAQDRPLADLMSQSIVSHVLKNETLNDDLLRLATELLPQHFDAEKARAFLASAPRINESRTEAKALQRDSATFAAEMAAREALIMAHYR